MFARGVLSLHTAPISVPKTPASKSCACLTSKLIETKELQVLYSGHLRKTGGRGSYRLVHAAHLAVQRGPAVKSSYSPTLVLSACIEGYERLSPNSNYSRTYVTPGGRWCTGLPVRPFPVAGHSPGAPALFTGRGALV